MSREINAHQFSDVYSSLGIELDKLGCVMLDLAKGPVLNYIPETEGRIEDELYVSKHPDRFWIDGAMAERKSHITLLYGLLSRDWQDHILRVLNGWDLPVYVELGGIEVFESPYSDEDAGYSCIVARVRVSPGLREGRARLELLPHINMFTEWKTHVTLAYVRSEYRDKWVQALEKNLPRILAVTGIDIGDQHD